MNNNLKFRQALLKARHDSMQPQSMRNVVEWAKAERYLAPDSTSMPGLWTPVFAGSVEPLLAATNPKVRNITLMTSAQLMKSDFILNVLGYYLSEDPTSVILAQPSEAQAEEFSKTRIETLIRDTKALSSKIKDKRDRDSGNHTFLKQFLNGAKLSVVSAAAPSDLASRSARVILMDEIDRYKTISREGDPEQLLQARATTYYNYLVCAVSTPTADGSSRIANRFNKSSKGYFHAKCNHCNNFEKPVWSQVYFDEKNPSDCGYICSHCNVMWSESDRHAAVKAGKFIHEHPENIEHLGFHANCIVNPFQPLSHFVKLYIEAKQSPESLRSFTNVHLAETYKPQVDAPDYFRIFENNRQPYQQGTIPTDEIKFLTMGVDVQADRIEAQVVGWTKNKQSYSIKYNVIMGPTHTMQPWNELQTLINSTFLLDNGNKMPISLTCIDSGFNTSFVHQFVQKNNPSRVRAIKGSDSLSSYFKMGGEINALPSQNGTSIYAHRTWVVGSSHIKTELFSWLKLNPELTDEGKIIYPQGFCHFPEYDIDYFKGLCSEALVLDKGKYSWQKLQARNEQLDTMVYARAAASMFGLDSFTTEQWDMVTTAIQAATNPQMQPTNQSNQPKKQSTGLAWKHPSLNRRRF